MNAAGLHRAGDLGYDAAMSPTKEAVIAQAMALSDADRLEVVERLSDSLATDDVSAAWEAEVDRRLDDVAAGRATFLPWEQARRRIVGDGDAPHG